MHFDLLNPELTEPDDEQLCEAEEHFFPIAAWCYCLCIRRFGGGTSGVIKRYNP